MTSAQQKKWRLLRCRLGRHPVWCAWQVTYRCNFTCRFCPYWRDEMARLPEQTLDQFERGARKLAKWGSLLISLAGGEPLLRQDLTDIIAVLGRWHFPLITTNGYLTTPELANSLFQAGLWGVSISIDYADPDRHDKARGQSGAWDKAVNALKIFHQARRRPWQRVNLMCVLMDDNLDQIEPLLLLAQSVKANFMVQPYSHLKTGNKKFLPRSDQSLSETLLALKKKYPHFLSNPFFLSKFDQFRNGGVPGCAAGEAFFNIDSTGDIAICVERKGRPVANLYRDPISFIGKALREGRTGNLCRDCWYNCRGEVESLYTLKGLWNRLPTLLFDR